MPGSPGRRELGIAFAAALGFIALARRDAWSVPFFWDELGFYVPWAWALLTEGLAGAPRWVMPSLQHPPLVPGAAAALSWIWGWGEWPFRAVALLAAAGYVAGTYALARLGAGRGLSAWVALAAGCAPVVLSQAGLGQPDLSMAGLAAWSLFLLGMGGGRGCRAAASALLALAVAANATVVVLFPVFGWQAACDARSGGRSWPRALLSAAAFLAPAAAVFVGWYLVMRGLWPSMPKEGGPESLRYNSYYLNGPAAVARRLAHRVLQLAVVDGRGVLVVGAAVAALAAWVTRREPPRRHRLGGALAAVVAVELLFLSCFGTTHQRYLLVALPALFVAASWALADATRARPWLVRLALGVTAGLGAFSWAATPPNKYVSVEYRARYVGEAKLVAELASRAVAARPAVVLARWPVTHALERPFLGFVREAVPVVDLSAGHSEILTAAGPRALVTLGGDPEALRRDLDAAAALGLGLRGAECEAVEVGHAVGAVCREAR